MKADATVRMTKATLDRISLRQTDFRGAIEHGEIRLEGDAGKLGELLGLLPTFKLMFNVVTP